MIKRSFFGGLGGASFEEDFKGSGEGWLLIRKKNTKVITNDWKRRYGKVNVAMKCFMLYESPRNIGQNSKMTFHLSARCRCGEFVDEKGKKHGFTLSSEEATLTVATFDKPEALKWIACIEKVIASTSPGRHLKLARDTAQDRASHPTHWDDEEFVPTYNRVEVSTSTPEARGMGIHLKRVNVGESIECSSDPLGLLQIDSKNCFSPPINEEFHTQIFDGKSFLRRFYKNVSLDDLRQGAATLCDQQNYRRQEVSKLVRDNFVSIIELNTMGDELARCSPSLPRISFNINCFEKREGNEEVLRFAENSIRHHMLS